MTRQVDEISALGLHRYQNWLRVLGARLRDFDGLQTQSQEVLEAAVYAYLEAREEQDKLIAAGLSREEIESVGAIPNLPLDPLAIVKKARAK